MTEPQIYDYHLAVYSKLLRGRTSKGPITQGAEARIISHDKNFRDELQRLVDPQSFFKETPSLMSMDARQMPGGVFLYRPFMKGDGSHYSVFGRLQARSEKGADTPGRNFTHFAALIVEDKWEPGLISWAARCLFEIEYDDDGQKLTPHRTDKEWYGLGEPVSEFLETRKSRTIPRLFRENLQVHTDAPHHVPGWPLRRLDGTRYQLRDALPDSSDDPAPQIAFADALAANLVEWDLAVHGRWLPFVFGCSHSVDVSGAGYAIRLDDGEPRQPVELRWCDSNPPLVKPRVRADARETVQSIYPIDGLSLHPARGSASSHDKPRLSSANFWPDQYHGSVLSDQDKLDAQAEAAQARVATPPPDPVDQTTQNIQSTIAETSPGPATSTPNAAPAANTVPADWFVQDDEPELDYSAYRAAAPEPAPEPEPPRLAATAPAQRTATQPPRTGRIRITWPAIPDNKFDWVLDPDLPELTNKQLHTFASFTPLMADPVTMDLLLNDEVKTYWAEAYLNCVGMICASAITSNLEMLVDPMEKILHHQPLESLNLREASFGGLHGQMLHYFFFTIVGMDQMQDYIRRRAKIARDIAAMDKDSGLHGSLLAPEPRDFENFILRLEQTPEGEKLHWNTGAPDIFEGFAEVAQQILYECRQLAKDRIAL